MVSVITSFADRLVERIVPSAEAAAACPRCPSTNGTYYYMCCPGCGLACYWKCQYRIGSGTCHCTIVGKC